MDQPVAFVYSWNGKPNFGDRLGPLLLERFAGVEARWSPPRSAEVVVVGSIAEHLPPRWSGTVLGIGKAHERTVPDLSRARVMALRGPLTLKGLDLPRPIILGDPGLLAARLLPERPPVVFDMGVIPHYSDVGLRSRFDGLLIDVLGPPLDVITQIAMCARIVSSSLHGVVVADALGIPRRWESFATVQGGGFKFYDYSGALGLRTVPGVWQEPPRHRIERATSNLAEAFAAYGEERCSRS